MAPCVSSTFLLPEGSRAGAFRDGKAEGRKTTRENRPLLVAGNAARGEPVAHRGVFGRRGRAPFGEFLALFRQQFH